MPLHRRGNILLQSLLASGIVAALASGWFLQIVRSEGGWTVMAKQHPGLGQFYLDIRTKQQSNLIPSNVIFHAQGLSKKKRTKRAESETRP